MLSRCFTYGDALYGAAGTTGGRSVALRHPTTGRRNACSCGGGLGEWGKGGLPLPNPQTGTTGGGRLLARLDDQHTAPRQHRDRVPRAFQQTRHASPDRVVRRRLIQRCADRADVKIMGAQLAFQLTWRIGSPEPKWCAIGTRPQPGPIRNNKDRPAPRPQHTVTLCQHGRRVIRRL
jgi:hypothetical protein